MGLGGLGRYLNAFMDADENEKDRILSLFKDAFGMQQTATTTQGLMQDMRMRELAEQRTQASFPEVLAQQKAATQQAQVTSEQAVRIEEEEREANRIINEQYGNILRVIMQQLEAGKAQEALGTIRAGQAMGLPGLRAQQAVTGARADISQALTAEETARQQRIQGAPAAEVRAGVAGAGAAAAQAGLQQQTFREAQQLGVGREVARSQYWQARAGASLGHLNQMITQEKVSRDYASTLAEAETIMAGLKDDVMYAELQNLYAKNVTGAGGKLDPLQFLLQYKGPDWLAEYLIRKQMKDVGASQDMTYYISQIDELEKFRTQMTLELQKPTPDLGTLLASFFMQNPAMQAKLAADHESFEEIDPTELLGSISQQMDVWKQMLFNDWGVRYTDIQTQGLAERTYSPEDITGIIRRIESNQALQGPTGDMLREWGAGISPANRADVLKVVTNIMAGVRRPGGELVKEHPMMWTERLREYHDYLISPSGAQWTQQDFDAALTILRAAAQELVQPGSIPQAQQPAGVTQ